MRGGSPPFLLHAQRQQVPILSSWNNQRLFRLPCVISHNVINTLTKNHCSLQPSFVLLSHKRSIQPNRERFPRFLLCSSLSGKAGRLQQAMVTTGSSSYLWCIVCCPVFVQKELYLIIFVGHLNLRQPKNSKSKRNISAINCRFCRAFWRRNRSVQTISFEVSKSLAANICTFHCTVKVL